MAQLKISKFSTDAETPAENSEKADADSDDSKSLERLTPEAREVLEHERVDVEHLTDRLEGRDGGLRPSKPTAQNDTGLEQFVWRWARFHSGKDTSIPVTADWDLDSWIQREGIDAEVSGITDEAGDEITEILEAVAKIVVSEFGHHPSNGIMRWQKAVYGQ